MPKGPAPRSIISRVEDKLVPQDGCLIFTGGLDFCGYGLIWDNIGRKKVRAHRIVYEHYNGPIAATLVIRHTCDVPACCNSYHLIIGTQQDNVQDMVDRNRAGKMPGESHPNAKLTEVQVLSIRELYTSGNYSYRTLAEEFCVSQGLIAQIITRRSWKHI